MNLTPNQTQVLAQLRLLLTMIGTFLVSRGYLKADQMATLLEQGTVAMGALMILGTMGWSLYSKRAAGIVKSAAALPSTTVITTTDPNIVAQTGDKVVSSAGG